MTPNFEILAYSNKSFVVRGDTKPMKKELKEAGGRWNPNLKGGAGWIFGNKRKEQVEVLRKMKRD